MPGGIRTPNLLIRSQLLYPVELQTLLPGGMLKVTEFGGTRKLMFDPRDRAGIIWSEVSGSGDWPPPYSLFR